MKLVSEEIDRYCIEKSSAPSDICQEIHEFTIKNVPVPQMVSGPLVGSFLGMMIGLTRANKVLEVGCYTGYSALAMAEKLPKTGSLITLDINAETQKIAQSFWDKSPHGRKIEAQLGAASDLMDELEGPFDLVFIDADKRNYLTYLQKALARLSPNGIVIADNCLWSGKVANAEAADKETAALQEFNSWVKAHDELEGCLLPIRDGLFVIRRVANH